MVAKLQKFRLLDTDPNITEDSTFGTTFRDTWDFLCPSNMKIMLQDGDQFSIKAFDSGDVEYVAPDALVKIEVRDPAGQKKINVYGPSNYKSATEFQDIKKMAKLRLEQPIEVKPRDHIVIMTLDSTGMDAASVANSFARILTSRIVEVGGRL